MSRWLGDPDSGPGGWDCDSDEINAIRDSFAWSNPAVPNTASEKALAEMRVKLGQAAICERRGEIELADAYGAVAGNKLARAYRIACNVLTMEGV